MNDLESGFGGHRKGLIKVNGISKTNLAFQTEEKWSPHLFTQLKEVGFQDYDMEVCQKGSEDHNTQKLPVYFPSGPFDSLPSIQIIKIITGHCPLVPVVILYIIISPNA